MGAQLQTECGKHGAFFEVRADLLACRGWQRLPRQLQQQVSAHYYAVLAYEVNMVRGPLDRQVADLRAWLEDGRLDAITDTLCGWGEDDVPPGDAGRPARMALAAYDAPRPQGQLAPISALIRIKTIHACAVAYWARQRDESVGLRQRERPALSRGMVSPEPGARAWIWNPASR